MDNNTHTYRTWIGMGEASRRLCVHAETIRRWIREGRIEYSRTPSGHYRFDAEYIETLLGSRAS